MSARQRVAILGAGAVGTVFAYALAERFDVTLVDVRADVVDAIVAAGGVAIEGAPVRAAFATRDPSRAFATSALFVFVKAPYTLAAVRPFAGKLNPATPIVSLQNGLGNEEAIKAALGGTVPLVIGATEVGGLAIGPGRSRRSEHGSTVIGSAGASTSTVQAVAALLESAGFPTSVAYDIRPHVWGKLLVNATVNPIAALAGAPNGIVARDPDAIELGRAVAYEAAAVARAARVALPFGDPWEYARSIALATASERNSMTVDVAARQRTEIDQTCGAIVAAGRRYGIATPYNETLLRLVRALTAVPKEEA